MTTEAPPRLPVRMARATPYEPAPATDLEHVYVLHHVVVAIDENGEPICGCGAKYPCRNLWTILWVQLRGNLTLVRQAAQVELVRAMRWSLTTAALYLGTIGQPRSTSRPQAGASEPRADPVLSTTGVMRVCRAISTWFERHSRWGDGWATGVRLGRREQRAVDREREAAGR